MQKNTKKVLIISPMILLLCMSSIGITAKAEDSITTTVIDNTGTSTTSTTSAGTASTGTTASTSTAGTTSTSTAGTTSTTTTTTNSTNISGPHVSGPSPSDPTGVNNQASTVTKTDETTVVETTVVETLPAWKNINGKLNYFTKDGIVKKTGWFKEKDENPNANNNNEYYLDQNYAATIGWKKIKESWYYFNEAGIKQIGWQLINYEWYHLDKNGIMEKGWIKDAGKRYYLNDEGIMTVGKKYIDDNWYFFGTDGIIKLGFYDNAGKRYYSTTDGIMVSNEWVSTKTNKYYVKADSGIATGDTIINNVMEKFDSYGRYIGSAKMTDHLFIKYLNVGDADCTFIKLPSGETALIDTGSEETSEKLVEFLKEQDLAKKNGKSVIDYVIITHSHSDHIGGLASVLDNFEVKKVYMPDIAIMKDWYSGVQVTTQNAADLKMMKIDYQVYNDAVKAMKDKKITFTNTKKGDFIDKNKILQFVQSDKNFGAIGSQKVSENYWGINENSAIVYLNYGDLQDLFAADMEWNSEKDFWTNNLLNGRDVDVLKVPHHGHDTSSTADFLRYLKPDIGIVSRSQESIEKNTAYNNMISNGINVYETSANDGVSIYATQQNWTVDTEKED